MKHQKEPEKEVRVVPNAHSNQDSVGLTSSESSVKTWTAMEIFDVMYADNTNQTRKQEFISKADHEKGKTDMQNEILKLQWKIEQYKRFQDGKPFNLGYNHAMERVKKAIDELENKYDDSQNVNVWLATKGTLEELRRRLRL